MSITQNELDKSIFQIKEKPKSLDDLVEQAEYPDVYFTTKRYADREIKKSEVEIWPVLDHYEEYEPMIEQFSAACGKIVQNGDRTQYFAKLGGSDGRLLDLTDPLLNFTPFKNKSSKVKLMNRWKKPQWIYREISKEVFNLYIRFLFTLNKSYLVNANRML